MDLRLKVLAAYDRGQSAMRVAKQFGISDQTVYDFIKRRAAGTLEPRKPGPPAKPVKLTDQDLKTIRQLVAQQPGITLKQLIKHMSVPVAESTMSRTLKRLGLCFKKSR